MVETVAFWGNGKTLKVRGFLAYFLAASSVAIAAAYFFSDESQHNSLKQLLSGSPRVWPKLDVNWRTAVATIVGFLGSSFGTVGGVGGGGIFVPLLNLVVGFDTKSAAALSKCMIMGASMSSVWYNLQVSHPIREVPILDYRLALLFQPMLMLGITFGVELSVIFPFWLITILIIILFVGTSSRSFFRGIQMWKQETIIKREIEEHEEEQVKACSVVIETDREEPLLPRLYGLQREIEEHEEEQVKACSVVIETDCEEPLLPWPQPVQKTGLETFLFNLRWKGMLVLMLVWFSFLTLQILKNNLQVCSNFYWFVNFLQIPIAVGVFSWQGVKLWKESRDRRRSGNSECVCEASIEWTAMQLIFCALCGLLGGTVGGLLGSGGGFILGPLLLELGVIPQVASATATFVMMFSSSLSVVEFYLLHRFPIPYALYLISVSVLAGFWGQCLVRKLVKVLGRASIIVFILSSVILASALTMGFVGAIKSITMIHNHEYMGFLDFCNH